MTETKTPYDEDASNAALRGDFNRATSFRNMADGYRAALAREVVSVEEIAPLIDVYWPEGHYEGAKDLLSKAIHALQLVPVNRERLIDVLAGLNLGSMKGKLLIIEAAIIADAILEAKNDS